MAQVGAGIGQPLPYCASLSPTNPNDPTISNYRDSSQTAAIQADLVGEPLPQVSYITDAAGWTQKVGSQVRPY